VARFYFNDATHDRFVLDDEGVELPSLSTAHLRAIKLIVRTHRFMDANVVERWTVRITDAAGVVLLTVLFPAAEPRRSAFGHGQHKRADGDDSAAILRSYAAALRFLGLGPSAACRPTAGPADSPIC